MEVAHARGFADEEALLEEALLNEGEPRVAVERDDDHSRSAMPSLDGDGIEPVSTPPQRPNTPYR